MNILVNKIETEVEFHDEQSLLMLTFNNEDIEEFLVKAHPEYAFAVYNEDEVDWQVNWYTMDSVQQFRVIDDIINNVKAVKIYAES